MQARCASAICTRLHGYASRKATKVRASPLIASSFLEMNNVLVRLECFTFLHHLYWSYILRSSSLALFILSIGMMIGRPCRACAFRKASVRIGELSVRIVVPMDMKNLFIQ